MSKNTIVLLKNLIKKKKKKKKTSSLFFYQSLLVLAMWQMGFALRTQDFFSFEMLLSNYSYSYNHFDDFD